MEIPSGTKSIFTAEIELQNGEPMVRLPNEDVTIGELEVGERYRIAILPRVKATSGAASETASRERGEPPVEIGETVEVEIEDLGEQGDGIARIGPGYVIFVPNTSIGDRVTIEITEARENFAFGTVIEDEPISG